MRDRTNISDALENHEENKNKDLSSTICEFVSLECTPQVRYIVTFVLFNSYIRFFCSFLLYCYFLYNFLVYLHVLYVVS